MAQSRGVETLEQKIEKFESLLIEIKERQREGHELLKELRTERREIERLLSTKELKKMVEDRVDEVVRTQLQEIGPEIERQCHRIYDRVGQQVDKIIDLSMGKEYSTVHGREDIRPLLAEKLKEWIKEVLADT
jgi:hypothetical protein